MDITQLTTDERQWFVMRDLKRRNAKQPAYLMFKDKGMEFFTPMVHKLLTINGNIIKIALYIFELQQYTKQ